MSYGPHHRPLKAIDIAGTIAMFTVFATTITAATLGALDLLLLPQPAWTLVFAVLPRIQSLSICEYDERKHPYLKSVTRLAGVGTTVVSAVLAHFLFEGVEQSSDPVLQISCWVLLAAFPLLKAVIAGYSTTLADIILDGRTLTMRRKK